MWHVKNKIDFGKELDLEAKAWKNIWSAGQGVATIKDITPTTNLVRRLKTEMLRAIEQQSKYLNTYT